MYCTLLRKKVRALASNMQLQSPNGKCFVIEKTRTIGMNFPGIDKRFILNRLDTSIVLYSF